MADHIDITPPGVLDGRGQKGKKTTVFQESELMEIRENPKKLTKEGIQKCIELWNDRCINTHLVIKFNYMLKVCKNIEKSGTTSRGEIIYSYDKLGNAKWIDKMSNHDLLIKDQEDKKVK